MKSLNDLVYHHLLDHHCSRGIGSDELSGRECAKAKGTFTVLAGAVMAIMNYVLYSVALVVLARHVYGPHTFGDFSAAVAAVTVGATAGTLGLEKYLLKLIPDYRARGELGLLRGFRRFAPGAAMMVTFVVAIGLFLVWLLSEEGSALHHSSLLVGIMVLPLVVLVCYFLEVATADGAYLAATFVYRVLFPALVLAGVFVLDQIYAPIVAEHAVAMWGVCWAIVLVIMVVIVVLAAPRNERAGKREFKRIDWLRHSSAYFSYSLLMSLMANSGVLVLGFINAQKQETAVYAIAAQLGALFVVVSTAVNRWYGPQISKFLATHDVDAGQQLIRTRRPIMWGLAVLYVLIIVFLGKSMLSLFGPQYVVGYVPLLIICAGTVVTAVNSIAPIYIQYVGREWTVPIMLGAGVGLTFALTIPLSLLWGVNGAAAGYSISGALLFIAFHLYARRVRRNRLRAIGRTDLTPLV